MKLIILLVALSACPLSAHADEATFQGVYIFGKNKITVEVGARGEDVFISSKCKKKVFKPQYDGEAGTYTAQDKSYALIPHPEYTFIEVESSNKCFPEGRYWKKN